VKKIRRWIAAICVLGVCLCTIPVKGFTFAQWVYQGHCGVVLWKADTAEKVVALTFDDGPDPQTTPRILEMLRRHSVPATFFVQGRMVERYPDLARQTAAQGHVIGNHTFSHPYLTTLSEMDIQREMRDGVRSIEKHLKLSTALFRPPRGDWNPTIFEEVRRTGSHLVLWSVAVERLEVKTPQAMAERALKLVKPGAILLLHDGANGTRETTVQALPLLLNGLKQRGYRCVTIPDLLHIPGNAPLPSP
jgi:peptidoglycan-N-acetylglucosamine deacetylase